MYFANLNTKEHTVDVKNRSGSLYDVTLDGKSYLIDFRETKNSYSLIIDGKSYEISSGRTTSGYDIWIESDFFPVNIVTELQKRVMLSQKSKKTAEPKVVKTEMPGKIVSIKKHKGDDIKKGETVIILEAMKMQNEIASPENGKIIDIYVKENQLIDAFDKLFKIKP